MNDLSFFRTMIWGDFIDYKGGLLSPVGKVRTFGAKNGLQEGNFGAFSRVSAMRRPY